MINSRKTSLFSGLKVVELSTILAGPSVGMFFAELGAEVIKIEHPQKTDPTRSWKLKNEDQASTISAYFCSVNYHKKYLKLDLKDRDDYKVFCQLIEKCDIFISNLRQSKSEKLALSYGALKKINPRLIYALISGYGTDCERAAFDVILQAETGYLSMTGEANGRAVKLPVAFIDILAAHQLKEAILIALLNRSKDNKGAFVSVSLFDAAVSSLANQATNWLMAEYLPKKEGSLHPNIAPYGEIFKLKDQTEIILACGNDHQFSQLAKALGLVDLLSNPLYQTNQNRVIHRQKLYQILSEKIINYDAKTLLNLFEKEDIPCGRLNTLADLFQLAKAKRLIIDEVIDGQLTKRVKTVIFDYKQDQNSID